jgi:RNA polymerase sigma-70 factor (ECF subfamily)
VCEPAGQLQERDYRAYCQTSLPRVYGYLRSRCGGSQQLAEDLAQEVFMAAAVEVRRSGTLPPMPWLYTVARNKLVDHVRRQEREQRALQLAWDAPEEPEDLSWMTAADVQHTLDALPALQRTALTLYYADGLPLHEVASLLGRSEHAVESLLARGRAAFRRAHPGGGDD